MSQKTEVTFTRYVKFKGHRYAAGAKVSVNAEDFAALDTAEAIHYSDKPSKESNALDLAELSRKELEKVKNDELKAYLDGHGIDYPSDAVKADLVKLVTSMKGDGN